MQEVINEINEDMIKLMKILQPGDIVHFMEDSSFTFEKYRYITKFEPYTVLEIEENGTIITSSNIVGKTNYCSKLAAITHVLRDGKIIWDNRTIICWEDYSGDRCYRGYILEQHYYDSPESLTRLVELITPYKEGKKGEHMVISSKEERFVEL